MNSEDILYEIKQLKKDNPNDPRIEELEDDLIYARIEEDEELFGSSFVYQLRKVMNHKSTVKP